MSEQPDPFLGLIFILIGTLVVSKLVSLFVGVGEPPAAQKEPCKLHKWSTNPATEKLQCTECNYVSGTHTTDGGNY